MRILVTGGTGFIGSNLTEELLRLGHDLVITGFDNELKIDNFNGELITGDLYSIDWNKIRDIDVLFHQAANNDTTLMDRNKMFQDNLDSSKKLFELVIKNGCKKIVYASSTAIYGDVKAPFKEDGIKNPLNPYAESKLLLDNYVEQLAKKHEDVIIVGLKYCNVYGKGEGYKGERATMIYQLAQQMIKENPRLFKFGEQKRDYIYIKDVVKANLLASEAKNSCIVNCGSGRDYSFNYIVDVLNRILNLDRKPEYIDNPYIGRYQDHTLCDMSLAKEKINFIPEFDLDKGIEDYYNSGELI
ncbi:NAD-dependent epimerase/dehydratase family protein [Candidatus Woesearchaeota archaeon]|nr:NAD-dependent epimerase/dehydratase family protein [Candidatus Woesearchaeota archaeon]